MNIGIFCSLRKSLKCSFLCLSLKNSSKTVQKYIFTDDGGKILPIIWKVGFLCYLYPLRTIRWLTNTRVTRSCLRRTVQEQIKINYSLLCCYGHYLTENSVLVNSYCWTFQLDFISECNSFYQRKGLFYCSNG